MLYYVDNNLDINIDINKRFRCVQIFIYEHQILSRIELTTPYYLYLLNLHQKLTHAPTRLLLFVTVVGHVSIEIHHNSGTRGSGGYFLPVKSSSVYTVPHKGALPDFFFHFPSCSADHERDWPPCKVFFFGLTTNTCTLRPDIVRDRKRKTAFFVFDLRFRSRIRSGLNVRNNDRR